MIELQLTDKQAIALWQLIGESDRPSNPSELRQLWNSEQIQQIAENLKAEIDTMQRIYNEVLPQQGGQQG